MILTDREIKQAIENGEIVIDPFDESNIGPTSYDVTLSPHFVEYPNQIFDPKLPIEFNSFTIDEDECVMLVPRHYKVLYAEEENLLLFRTEHAVDIAIDPEQICLARYNKGFALFSALIASTNEYIKLPSYISAEYTGRSSLGRVFLQSHQTAGWIDAGFEGMITLEMVAFECPVILYPNMKIGQLIFYKHNECHTPYCRRKSSKYNKQIGATPTRLHVEFIDSIESDSNANSYTLLE